MVVIDYQYGLLECNTSGVGNYSKVRGYLSYRTHLYGEKLHSYGVTVKSMRLQPP